MQLLVLLLGTALGILYLRSHDYYFWLEWRRGYSLVMRGTVPKALHADFRDILSVEPEVRVSLRVRRSGGSPALLIHGRISDGTRQRLLNVFGLYRQSLRHSGKPPDRRNLGQIIGLPWLAFALESEARSSTESKKGAPAP